jgi:hypothetical protein
MRPTTLTAQHPHKSFHRQRRILLGPIVDQSTYARWFSAMAFLTNSTVSLLISGSSPTILLYGSARFLTAS